MRTNLASLRVHLAWTHQKMYRQLEAVQRLCMMAQNIFTCLEDKDQVSTSESDKPIMQIAYYNDMWRFNVDNGQWALLARGSASAGTLGVESTTYFPNARSSATLVGHFVTATDSLYLFGGRWSNSGTSR
jgi:hypothetical protein